MEGNWSSDSLQVLLCWEMLTWKGIKTIPLVDLTLLILLISATRWVTSCYTITHTVQVQHAPIYKCNSYIHKEQLLWCSSPASPKAQLTQDRNEGLLFTISHAGCTEKVKPKPEGWHREKTQKTPWFMWLWSNSPAQPSDSLLCCHCQPLLPNSPASYLVDFNSTQMRMAGAFSSANHLIKIKWTTSSKSNCTYAPATTAAEFCSLWSNLISFKAPGNPLIKTHYLQLPGAWNHGMHLMVFMQLCTVNPSNKLHSCSCSSLLPHTAVSFLAACPRGTVGLGLVTVRWTARQQRNHQALTGEGGIARQ